MKLKDNENFVVLGIFLGLTGVLSALVLSVFSTLTSRPIAAARSARENRALRQILPEFDNDINAKVFKVKSPAGWEILIRQAKTKGKTAGYAVTAVNPAGYAGAITMLAGVSPDGKIRTILITEHKETPGLGAELCKREHKKTIFNLMQKTPEGIAPNKYLDQFAGLSVPAGGWQTAKDGGTALYATGATVTSRALAKSASEIALAFKKHRKAIIAAFGGDK
jgi:electron transport complex protein RnfG